MPTGCVTRLCALYGEYVWAYISAIRNAPLSPVDRRLCYRYLAQWVASRPGADRTSETAAGAVQADVRLDIAAAGRPWSPS